MELHGARPIFGNSNINREDAEEALAEATVRLQMAKLDAILGKRYHADEFDRLVTDYRQAKLMADAMRATPDAASLISIDALKLTSQTGQDGRLAA